MNGVIQGGWSFVIAAWGLTGLALTIYTLRVLRGLVREERHER